MIRKENRRKRVEQADSREMKISMNIVDSGEVETIRVIYRERKSNPKGK